MHPNKEITICLRKGSAPERKRTPVKRAHRRLRTGNGQILQRNTKDWQLQVMCVFEEHHLWKRVKESPVSQGKPQASDTHLAKLLCWTDWKLIRCESAGIRGSRMAHNCLLFPRKPVHRKLRMKHFCKTLSFEGWCWDQSLKTHPCFSALQHKSTKQNNDEFQ